MPENNSNGAAPPASSEPAGGDSGPSLKDFLDFDPFEPSDEGKAATPPSDEPATEVAGDALPPESQPQQQTPSPQRGDDPVLRELARINETLAASRQPQYQQPPQAASAPKPRYNLEIPQHILKSVIHSEDPEERAIGLSALINGLANTIYNDVSAEFRAQQEQMIAAIPQMHQRLSVEQTEQQRAAQDFFGRFSSLRQTPQMMQFVANEAKALAVEQWQLGNRNLQWNEAFREELGRRVYESLGFQVPGMQAQAPQAPRQPKRPQFAAGANQKGGSESAAPNAEAKEIWDVFGYN